MNKKGRANVKSQENTHWFATGSSTCGPLDTCGIFLAMQISVKRRHFGCFLYVSITGQFQAWAPAGLAPISRFQNPRLKLPCTCVYSAGSDHRLRHHDGFSWGTQHSRRCPVQDERGTRSERDTSHYSVQG